MEIMARVAKVKFYDRKMSPTVAQSLQYLLDFFIIPNNLQVMSWRGFREEKIWTLEIDLIFRANRAAIENLFYYLAGEDKIFSKDECMDLLKQV